MTRKKKSLLWIWLAVCLLAGLGTSRVQAEDSVIYTFAEAKYIPAAAVEINQSPEALLELLKNSYCKAYTNDSQSMKLPVKWDISEVDFSTVGAWTIHGSVVIPEGYTCTVKPPDFQTQVSVQSRTRPEINGYSRMVAAGLYFFPWLPRTDADQMSAWLCKEGSGWVDASSTGAASCTEEGLYISVRSMVPGNNYTLTVLYEGGKTRNLCFYFQQDRSIQVLSYLEGSIGEVYEPGTCISSCEKISQKTLERLAAFAVKTGGSLDKVTEELGDFALLANVTPEYEDTAENPAFELQAQWDMSGVPIWQPGVYQITGTFQIPEGYTLKEGFSLPEVKAYVSVQEAGKPQINTYYMPGPTEFRFPMVLEGLTEEQKENFYIYIKKNEEEYQLVSREDAGLVGNGLWFYISSFFQNNCTYKIYAEYPGGTTGIYSFLFDDNFITNENWCERTFGDRDGETLPDISQEEPEKDSGSEEEPGFGLGKPSPPEKPEPTEAPEKPEKPEPTKAPEQPEEPEPTKAPEKPEEPEPTKAPEHPEEPMPTKAPEPAKESGQPEEPSVQEIQPVTERVTDTETTISGRRLETLLEEAGETLGFEKNGILLRLPKELVRKWEIGPEETLTVEIQNKEENGFSVHITAGEEEITEIPGASVELPVENESDGETVQALDTRENTVQGAVNEERGTAELSIEETGDYQLAEADSSQKEEKTGETKAGAFEAEGPEAKALAAFGAAAAALAGAVLIKRKQAKKKPGGR